MIFPRITLDETSTDDDEIVVILNIELNITGVDYGPEGCKNDALEATAAEKAAAAAERAATATERAADAISTVVKTAAEKVVVAEETAAKRRVATEKAVVAKKAAAEEATAERRAVVEKVVAKKAATEKAIAAAERAAAAAERAAAAAERATAAISAAEKAAAEKVMAAEKVVAERRAAAEKAAAEKVAAEEAADAKSAAEKAADEKGAAAKRVVVEEAAAEKAAPEKAAAEEAAAERRAAGGKGDRIYPSAVPNLSLAVRDGYVVLAKPNSEDLNQHWFIYERFSTHVKDVEGRSTFIILNSGTGMVLQHAIKRFCPVQLTKHDFKEIDRSVLWTFGDFNHSFKIIRSAIDIGLECFTESGKYFDGVKILLYDLQGASRILWKIQRW